MDDKTTESEFGKGFVYNLILFAKHFENHSSERIQRAAFIMSKSKEEREKILCDNPDPSHNYGKDATSSMRFFVEKEIPIYDGSEKKAMSHLLELWANGASDHLYEIEVPERYKGTEVERLTLDLKSKALKMGHGFPVDKIWDYDEDFVWLIETTKKIGILVDEEFGVDPVRGNWE